MSDAELIARMLDGGVLAGRMIADRIEFLAKTNDALTAKVKLMDDLDVINGEKIEALEAKLAKAVRLLRATRSRLNRSPFDLFLELDAFLAEQGENP